MPVAAGLALYGGEPEVAALGDVPVDSETASFADHLQSLLPDSEGPERSLGETFEGETAEDGTADRQPNPADSPIEVLLRQTASRPLAFLSLGVPGPPGVTVRAESATAAPAEGSTEAPPVDEPVASLPAQTPPPAQVATCVTSPSDHIFGIPVQAQAPPPEGGGTQELAGSSLPPRDVDAEVGSTKRTSPPPAPQSKAPDLPKDEELGDLAAEVVACQAGPSIAMPPRGQGAEPTRSDVSARAATETAPVNHAGTAGSRAGADPSAKGSAGTFGGVVNENTAQATASSGIAFAARLVEHQTTVNPLAQEPPALPGQVQPVSPPASRPGADSSRQTAHTGAEEKPGPQVKPLPQGPVRAGDGHEQTDASQPPAQPTSDKADDSGTDDWFRQEPVGEPQARGPSPYPVTGAASVPAPAEAHALTAAGGASGSSLQPAVRENPRASEFVRQAGATAEVPTVGTVPATTGPVRDLVLSVNGPVPEGESATAVSLRVVERQGEIHFSVRAQDEQLKQSLRTHLEQLVEGLDRRGFQAETWHPIQAASPARDPAGGREDPSFGQDAQSGGHRDRKDESGSGRHGRRDGSPLWLEELEGQMQF